MIASRFLLTATVGAIAFLLSCGMAEDQEKAGSAGDPPAFSRRDSAGILLSVTEGPAARSALPWKVDSIPDLVLGEGTSLADEFFGIRGLRGLPNGGILVVDGVSREMRFFDQRGEITKVVGRKGEGPGEFDDPWLVRTVGTDSLLLWDGRLQRFQLFSSEGETPRTIRLKERWPKGSRPPDGAVGPWMLVPVQEMLTEAILQRPGLIELETDYIWLNPATWEQHPIASFTIIRGFSTVERGQVPRISSVLSLIHI